MGLMDDLFKSTVEMVAYDPDIRPGLVLATYTPVRGESREIYVSVIYQGIQKNNPQSQTVGPAIGARILRHATRGVLDLNLRDTLTLPLTPGGDPVEKTIGEISSDSNAAEWSALFL